MRYHSCALIRREIRHSCELIRREMRFIFFTVKKNSSLTHQTHDMTYATRWPFISVSQFSDLCLDTPHRRSIHAAVNRLSTHLILLHEAIAITKISEYITVISIETK